MAKNLSPDQIAAKWAQNLSSATASIQAGVEGVTVAPGLAASRQAQLYLQRVQQRVQVWQKNVASVSLQDWQQAMVSKGIPRIATGAQAATGKFSQFMSKLMPYVTTGVRNLPQRGGLDANIARVTAWIRYMAQFNGGPAGQGG